MRAIPRRRSFSLSVALLALAALACGPATRGHSFHPASVPREKVGLPLSDERGEFWREWTKSDLDLGGYDGILLVPLELVYSEHYVRNHRFDANRYGRSWPTSERIERQRAADLAQLRRLFREALAAELQRTGRYTLVDRAGPDVISLSVGVLDLDLTRTHLEQDTRGLTAFDRPQTITIAASLRDGASAEHLGVMLEPSVDYGTTYKSGAGGAVWSGVRGAFADWSRDFRALLERTGQAPSPPPGA